MPSPRLGAGHPASRKSEAVPGLREHAVLIISRNCFDSLLAHLTRILYADTGSGCLRFCNILPLEISPVILNSVLTNLLTVKWATSELSSF